MRKFIREELAQAGPDPKDTLAQVQAEKAKLMRDVDRLLENLTLSNRDFVDDKLGEIRRRLRDLQAREDELQAHGAQTPDLEAAVETALAQVARFREVLAHGSIVEQKALLRGFIASISLQATQHQGVITWYDSSIFNMRRGTRDEAEKMQIGGCREAIRWDRDAWRMAASLPKAVGVPARHPRT